MWYGAHMHTIIYIVGPTASGKTKLATTIAGVFNGILVSADSIQVYKGLDIVSGKDLDKGSSFQKIKQIGALSLGTHLINDTPIYGLDIVGTTYSFHVADYYSYALKAIELIKEQKKIPIVVGGTTLYVGSLLDPPDTMLIPSNKKRREELN